ncbi:hypothetical protein ACFXMT_29180 [Streptomyces mirabilis]|uniref:hypothetical protein n=1 Tax=Streptomyces mirabilis TaxID=68239 RepID=UPI0036CB02D6
MPPWNQQIDPALTPLRTTPACHARRRTASSPCARSGGHRVGDRTWLTFDALVHHAVELSGVHGRRPRVMYVGTAIGDAWPGRWVPWRSWSVNG